jgi:hypothetical protein
MRVGFPTGKAVKGCSKQSKTSVLYCAAEIHSNVTHCSTFSENTISCSMRRYEESKISLTYILKKF